MENNPIKQRIQQLTEMWNEAVITHKDAVMYGWVGNSSVDYKMVRGFVVYHTSQESTTEDIFLCMHHPFEDAEQYGQRIVYELGEYINAWNSNENLSSQTGTIKWKPGPVNVGQSDELYFTNNINDLANAIQIQEERNYLVVALLPQMVNSYANFSNWLVNVLRAGICSKVRLMIYDTYELNAFKSISEAHPQYFKYLYPDLDMPGAMNQVLESAKQGKKSEADREAVHFQQMLLKLTDAISKSEARLIDEYMNQCLVIAQKYSWPHMEALVYFFMHSHYYAQDDFEKSVHAIDKSIAKADEAVATRIVIGEEIRYHYRIAKGNLFYMNKKFADAAEVYQSCLALDQTSMDMQVLLGIYQMLGSSKRHNGEKEAAWNCFRDGWSLVNKDDSNLMKGNIMLMLYGKDMIETGKEISVDTEPYGVEMNQWWGENWMVKLYSYTPTLN